MSCSWVRWHADFCCCTETFELPADNNNSHTIMTDDSQIPATAMTQFASCWALMAIKCLPPHTHNHFMALLDFVCDYRVSQHQKDKTNMDLLEQETVSGSSISWAICKSAPWLRHITMPASHHSVFLQAGCPSCCPTNSIKALKAVKLHEYIKAT